MKDKPCNLVMDEEAADFHSMIDADVATLRMTDMDAFAAWRLGLAAYGAARELSAKFPHDVDDPVAPCCGRLVKDCDCDPCEW